MVSDSVKIGGGILAAGLILLGGCNIDHASRETFRVTVTDKQIKRDGDHDTYMVFGKLPNGKTRVFENIDSMFERKWNSSDVWAQIEQGKTYDLKTYGFRIPFFSYYENIIGVQEVQPPQ